ncbi:hypothetical protein L226DRAFT_611954 [Lentinus tigrinus ALCF2SS1-7]|uniref:uncharacterized protein n=1 Tax=Lentinus tigrinus ALCF2SS1-7 TaxID=1328758 RepID=UPI001165E25D|nr:hypothetical protein L226DRAFT_611954 [Lentinus tigrinus ALCF2SS1-7]
MHPQQHTFTEPSDDPSVVLLTQDIILHLVHALDRDLLNILSFSFACSADDWRNTFVTHTRHLNDSYRHHTLAHIKLYASRVHSDQLLPKFTHACNQVELVLSAVECILEMITTSYNSIADHLPTRFHQLLLDNIHCAQDLARGTRERHATFQQTRITLHRADLDHFLAPLNFLPETIIPAAEAQATVLVDRLQDLIRERFYIRESATYLEYEPCIHPLPQPSSAPHVALHHLREKMNTHIDSQVSLINDASKFLASIESRLPQLVASDGTLFDVTNDILFAIRIHDTLLTQISDVHMDALYTKQTLQHIMQIIEYSRPSLRQNKQSPIPSSPASSPI